MKPMDKYDQPMLSAAGFEAGFSGYSWFGKDRSDNEWQAHLDDKSVFSFRTREGEGLWGANSPMSLMDFRKLFQLGEHE